MGLPFLTGDTVRRTAPGAEPAAYTLVRENFVTDQMLTFPRPAFLVPDVFQVFIPEILHRGQGGVRR
jgi:hypothetical protein